MPPWILINRIASAGHARALALGVDYAAIAGDGMSNNPVGILNYPDIPTMTIGADTGNGAEPDFAMCVAMEKKVAQANALFGALAYLTNAQVSTNLKVKQRWYATDSPVWSDNPRGGNFGTVNGYLACASNQVPSSFSEGESGAVLSALIFGNWQSMLIGQWGPVDILVNPFLLGTSGAVQVRVFQDVDIAVRHTESFAICNTILTSEVPTLTQGFLTVESNS